MGLVAGGCWPAGPRSPPGPAGGRRVDPDLRGALLIGGLLFVGVFAAMTIQVVIEDGLTC